MVCVVCVGQWDGFMHGTKWGQSCLTGEFRVEKAHAVCVVGVGQWDDWCMGQSRDKFSLQVSLGQRRQMQYVWLAKVTGMA